MELNKSLSLIENYKAMRAVESPANVLIQRLMDITGRAEMTVRMWLCGKQRPDKNQQQMIAESLGIDAMTLFPPKRSGRARP